jgi:hypothetical protein
MNHISVSPDVRIVCGRGSDGNRGDQHRAISIARQLHAVGKWPGQQDVIIHEPHDLHRQVQHSGLQFCINGVPVYPGIYDLVEGQHYEVAGRTTAPETPVGKTYTYSSITWHVYGPAEPDGDGQPRWWVGTGTDDLEIWDDDLVRFMFDEDDADPDADLPAGFEAGWNACIDTARSYSPDSPGLAAIDSINLVAVAVQTPNTFEAGWDAASDFLRTAARGEKAP